MQKASAASNKTSRPATAGKTTMLDFSAPIDRLEDVDVRIKSLENAYSLRNQLCLDWIRGRHGEGSLNWSARIYMLDGRRVIAEFTGTRFDQVVNRVFKEAGRILKGEYGTAAGSAAKTA